MSRLKVTVDHGAIERNVARLVTHAAGSQVMAVVKADAYGHGLTGAAAAARAGGATWLGVAQPDEAIALREAGDTGRLLCWLYGPEAPFRLLIRRGVDLSASSLAVLDMIIAAARMAGEVARVHVCLDTGLSREGVRPEQLGALLDAALAADDAVVIVGVWSHLAWADAPGHPTIDRQAEVFRAGVAEIESRGIALEVRHLANSAATLTRPDLHFDLVRPGIAVYGLPPVPDAEGGDWGLEPAMRVTASLALVKEVPAGEGVSYGHEYTTPRDTRLGLVTAGYSDGIFRAAGGGRGPLAVGGERFVIAGRVCMDQVVLDLGADSTARAGDEVVLIGADGPSAREWAAACDTIDYEIVCRFGGLKEKHLS